MSLFDEMDAIADALPQGASFDAVPFSELRRNAPQALFDDAVEVWRLRYAARETLMEQARHARLQAISLELGTLPPGEEKAALAAEAAKLYAPQRPDGPPEATWGD
jgi:hypothetical protein